MFSAIVDKNTTLDVPLSFDSELFEPDAGTTVTYSVLRVDGTEIDGFVDVELQEPQTGWVSILPIPLPAAVNTLSDGELSTKHHVIVNCTINGSHKSIRTAYRVCVFPTHTVTPSDVRLIFGVNNSDIADDKIDVDEGYFMLINEQGPQFSANFVESTKSFMANRALALYTAIQFFGRGLSMFAAQTETDGTSKMARFEKGSDFKGQLATAESELQEILNELNGVDESTSTITIFMLANPETDVVTGA